MPKSAHAPSTPLRPNATKCCSGSSSFGPERRKRFRALKRADASGTSGDENQREQKMSELLSIARPQSRRPHVVIIGGGFAGIAAAKALRHCDADVTIID